MSERHAFLSIISGPLCCHTSWHRIYVTITSTPPSGNNKNSIVSGRIAVFSPSNPLHNVSRQESALSPAPTDETATRRAGDCWLTSCRPWMSNWQRWPVWPAEMFVSSFRHFSNVSIPALHRARGGIISRLYTADRPRQLATTPVLGVLLWFQTAKGGSYGRWSPAVAGNCVRADSVVSATSAQLQENGDCAPVYIITGKTRPPPS